MNERYLLIWGFKSLTERLRRHQAMVLHRLCHCMQGSIAFGTLHGHGAILGRGIAYGIGDSWLWKYSLQVIF